MTEQTNQIMRELVWILAAAILVAIPAVAEDQRMEVVLEKRSAAGWGVAEPGQVLDQGDEVRFRLTSNMDGRLYVYNRTPEGRSELIFPDGASSTENRLEAGQEFLMPEDGAFGIEGPPGHDLIYWVVSPEESRRPPMEISQLLTPANLPAPPRFTPSCDETVLRARSLCVDPAAGAQVLKPVSQSTSSGTLKTRSITIEQDRNAAVITSPRSRDGFVIFEYRLAHR